MNTTQEKIRHISMNHGALRTKDTSVDAVTAAFMEHVNKVALELASKGTHVSGVRILEASVDEKGINFKFDDPDNLIDHVSLHLNKENPEASIEVHHTSDRS